MLLNSYIIINKPTKLRSNSQHSFRLKISKEKTLITITDKLYDNIDNKDVSLLILSDLSKSFDTVNYKTLLNKCSVLDIDDYWFNNYLNERIMLLRFENRIYKKKALTMGSHKVRFWGRFGIYITDFSVHVNGFPVQYADDTQFLHLGTMDNLHQIIKYTEDTCKM